MVNQEQRQIRGALHQALRAMASVDEDMALQQNGRGFGKVDGPIGHALADQDPDGWSPKQAMAAYQILTRYKNTQLPLFGIDLDAIGAPEEPIIAEARAQLAQANGNESLALRVGRLALETHPIAVAPSTIFYRAKDSRIVFGFPQGDPDFQEKLDAVRGLIGRKWEPYSKTWAVPVTAANITACTELMLKYLDRPSPFSMDEETTAALEVAMVALEERVRASYAASVTEYEIDGLREGMTLYPFQIAGVKFIIENKRVILADDMGLGKTPQSIAAVAHQSTWPVLVICPASLKLNWKREFERWVDAGDRRLYISVLSGRPTPEKIIQSGLGARALDNQVRTDSRKKINQAGLVANDPTELVKPGAKPGVRKGTGVRPSPKLQQPLNEFGTGVVDTGDPAVTGQTDTPLAVNDTGKITDVDSVGRSNKRDRITDLAIDSQAAISRGTNDRRSGDTELGAYVIPTEAVVEHVDRLNESFFGDFSKSHDSPRHVPTMPDVIIVNYDVLDSWLQALGNVAWGAIICDEAHFLKSSKAKRTKAVQALVKKQSPELTILATGTPFLSRPIEGWTLINIINHQNTFGGWMAYTNRYCDAKPGYGGYMDVSGASNTEELNRILRSSGAMVRRRKDEVLKELPSRTWATVPMEMNATAARKYIKAEADVVAFYAEMKSRDAELAAQWNREAEDAYGVEDRISPVDAWVEAYIEAKRHEYRASEEARLSQSKELLRWEALKQLAYECKRDAVFDWIDTFLESEEKLVVFANHRAVVQEIADRYNAPTIMGGQKPEEIERGKDRFQKDPHCRVMVANIKAGGVGHTLTAASNVCFVELGWTPADMDQALDRTHRIGQDKPVTGWILTAELPEDQAQTWITEDGHPVRDTATVEGEIARLIAKKRAVVESATDGSGAEAQVSVMAELRKRINRRKRG